MTQFSDQLIREYQEEMRTTYGVFVSASDAQVQLRALVHTLFPSATAVKRAESRERSARKGAAAPTCARSLSATLTAAGGTGEVVASITHDFGKN